MADDAFRAEMHRRRYDPHVAPINRLADQLSAGRGLVVPHVPPHCGGVRASILALLSNPGPGAGGARGSGFVSWENAAPSSARLAAVYDAAGVAHEDLLIWNAFPWYVHDELRGRTTAAMRREGAAVLPRLLALLPELQVVVLHGADARDTWARLLAAPDGAGRDLVALPTWHPSDQVFAVPAPVRAEREQDLVDAYVEAASLCRP